MSENTSKHPHPEDVDVYFAF